MERPIKKTGYLVITSDRGLVGAYNSSILKAMVEMISENHKSADEYAILAVGGTGADFFKARQMNLSYEYRGVSDVPSFNEVREIIKQLLQCMIAACLTSCTFVTTTMSTH